ncbi:MAG: amino acid ABC transporter permease [Spirochaetaceae bacterium]|jgi:polar amino acid transport system permease protein|nr:amino acid ABC transporter permease [Spirochaetaceae bacterium]
MKGFTSLIDIAVRYRVLLWDGTRTTLFLSFVTILIASVLGTFLALAKMSKLRPLRWAATAYVEIIRGTPLLVQIAIVFYGLPMMGIRLPSLRLGDVDFERLFSGILALSLNSTAYVCEIIRSGIQSIDRGQMEAARAIGFSAPDAMRLVVLPQAVRNILPALANEFVTLIKESSQVSVIGMAELMYAADTIRGNSFRPMEPLIIAAAIYFTMTFSLSRLLAFAEKRMGKSS